MTPAAAWATLAATAFALGSIPSGVLVARRAGADPRRAGSQSTGATNVLRVVGASAAAATLALDFGKGAVAAWLAAHWPGLDPAAALFGTLAAACGHAWSPWLRGQGGKGIATTAGGLAIADPAALAISTALFAAGVGVSRRVSVGSLIAAAGLPAVLAALGRPRRDLALAILLAVLVVFWHRGNLRRLLRGQEPVVGPRGREDR